MGENGSAFPDMASMELPDIPGLPQMEPPARDGVVRADIISDMLTIPPNIVIHYHYITHRPYLIAKSTNQNNHQPDQTKNRYLTRTLQALEKLYAHIMTHRQTN